VINLSRQSLCQKDIQSVLSTLKSNKITRGSSVINFEKAICKYTGCKYAVAVNSASSALLLAYKVLGLKPKEIVWTTPVTFVSTLTSALHLGANFDFVDIGKDFNLDFELFKKKLLSTKKKFRPNILTNVHLRGLPTDQEKFFKLKKKFNFKIIEDASHSLGGSHKKNKVGSCKWSDIAVLSFHPSKTITTGEGGMILTNKKEYYKLLLLLRNNFIDKDSRQSSFEYEFKDIGYNFWMNDIQASLGLSQLSKINFFLKKRTEKAKIYDALFKGTKFFVESNFKDKKSSNHLYLINCQSYKNKIHLMGKLRNVGIETTTHYPLLYKQKFIAKFKKEKFKFKKTPNSEKYSKSYLSIPIFPDLTKKEQVYIVKNILKYSIKN